MKLGFTGTRNGLTQPQRDSLVRELLALYGTGVGEFHHGSCRGSDVAAAKVVRMVCEGECRIVSHPGPDGDSNRDSSGVDDEAMPPLTHFARNRNIVDGCDLLLACPPCKPLPTYGGTSYTVGYARKKGKPVWIFWPDGSVDKERDA